ncbi:hypothetical protein Ctob_010502 [Chrysochromulina tobinii]|uniref:Uncharacterized protein n=1 Tax=Chrysochromulina tobinii TaxID=1460289 RepID=A0A0M0JV67_9EUKA|nr:hypothetical protein Ctob_010502 [Chrysochromulina tobinii]|eukprot:KOO30571.1 hypothetical protein Ctob_010502 [Chrysochromulina sp. CCMP291]
MKRSLYDAPAVARNETGKALFVRDAQGNLVTVRPGEALPEKAKAATEEAKEVVSAAEEAREAARLAARSQEDIQYEAYMNGKDMKRGNVWMQNVNVASADRAAAVDSIAADVAEEQLASGKEHAPSRAYDRSSKIKRGGGGSSSGSGSYGGALSVSEARAGAEAASAALARAREASDDEENDDLNASAATLLERAMRVYNMPVSNLPQLDPYGNDLRVPALERKIRKFLACFGEEVLVRTLDGQALVVLYRAQGGELTGMWIAPDTDGLGADAAAAEAVVRKADVFARFSKLLRRLSGGRRLTSRWEVMQSQNNPP